MATRAGESSATPWLAFLVGALVVIVGVIGYIVYTGQSSSRKVDVAINTPSVSAPAAPAPAPAPAKPGG